MNRKSCLRQLNNSKTVNANAFRLFYLKELSYKEVADITQLDLKQVKSNIQNGKRNLQLILAQAFKD
jgi:DNA-directed RNA polymerase specialized sigma24 family protein